MKHRPISNYLRQALASPRRIRFVEVVQEDESDELIEHLDEAEAVIDYYRSCLTRIMTAGKFGGWTADEVGDMAEKALELELEVEEMRA